MDWRVFLSLLDHPSVSVIGVPNRNKSVCKNARISRARLEVRGERGRREETEHLKPLRATGVILEHTICEGESALQFSKPCWHNADTRGSALPLLGGDDSGRNTQQLESLL